LKLGSGGLWIGSGAGTGTGSGLGAGLGTGVAAFFVCGLSSISSKQSQVSLLSPYPDILVPPLKHCSMIVAVEIMETLAVAF
jgi:hypothetical protein